MISRKYVRGEISSHLSFLSGEWPLVMWGGLVLLAMGLVGEGHRAGEGQGPPCIQQGPSWMDGRLEGGWRQDNLNVVVQGEDGQSLGSPAGGLLSDTSGGDAGFHLGCAEGVRLWDIQAKVSQSRQSHRSGRGRRSGGHQGRTGG